MRAERPGPLQVSMGSGEMLCEAGSLSCSGKKAMKIYNLAAFVKVNSEGRRGIHASLRFSDAVNTAPSS